MKKSIDFLLEHAGPVIQYRLRKEILRTITPTQETYWLDKIYQTPNFKLVQSYAKPNGYIGIGMHGRDSEHETRLQDGETAARLLSSYAIPKDHPLVAKYVAALRDDAVLQHEFLTEPKRFWERFLGLSSGWCLMTVIYTLQAMLGYGDDYKDLQAYQETCLKAFRRVLGLASLDDITKHRQSKAKYNYPYIEADEHFPFAYTHVMLAYTQSWRTPENVQMLADSLNHINKIMVPGSDLTVKVGSTYYARGLAFNRPVKPFRAGDIDVCLYRRMLTEIAMLGVGESVGVIKESVNNVLEAIDADGILRMNFSKPHNKRYSPRYLVYPGAYNDDRLEPFYEPRKKEPIGLLCDLTFWAVQFLTLVKGESP